MEECAAGVLRSLGEGGHASAGFAEDTRGTTAVKPWGSTGTLQYKPVPSLTTRLEYRYDKSNQNVFQAGGRATSYQPTLSFEAIYAF